MPRVKLALCLHVEVVRRSRKSRPTDRAPNTSRSDREGKCRPRPSAPCKQPGRGCCTQSRTAPRSSWSASTCAMSRSLRTASPRDRCQPINSTGIPLDTTMRAASGIDPDVVLRRGSDVALAARRSPHDHAAAHVRGNRRLSREGQSEVCERRQRHDRQPRMLFGLRNDGIGRVPTFHRSFWRRVPVLAQAVAP